MKKRILSLMLIAAMTMSLTACGSSADAKAEAETTAKAAETTEKAAENTAETEAADDELELEQTTIKWAKDSSGNCFLGIALEKGWFEEVGLKIEEVPIDNSVDAVSALAAGQVDIISNYGTCYPLSSIGTGEDIQIIGGYMATGCIPIVAKEGAEWNGVESLVGKKIASMKNQYVLTRKLMEAGYEPFEDVEWLEYSGASDRLAAVAKGEADYGVLSTSRNYEASQTEGIEVVGYMSDIWDWYSCCRMCVMGDYLEENPNTVKTIMKVLLRAQSWYEASEENKEETIDIMVDYMGVTREFLESYMKNDHMKISVDPLKNTVVEAWDVLLETDSLPEGSENINIEDYIKEEVYREALDMAIEEYYDEAPEFYDKMVEFYDEHNK